MQPKKPLPATTVPKKPATPQGMKFDVPPEIASAIHRFGGIVGVRKLRKVVEARAFEEVTEADVQAHAKALMSKAFDDLS